jgi:hypothetical protein
LRWLSDPGDRRSSYGRHLDDLDDLYGLVDDQEDP